MQRKRSFVILLLLAVVLASASASYGGNILGGPFLTDPPARGTVYTGEIAITADIVTTPKLPAWAIPPLDSSTELYNNVLVTLTLVMKLRTKKDFPETFSGIGKRPVDPAGGGGQTIYFNLPGDYISSYRTLGKAVYDFVKEQKPGSLLTRVAEVNDNVTEQLNASGTGLGTESPFFMWLEVEVVQP